MFLWGLLKNDVKSGNNSSGHLAESIQKVYHITENPKCRNMKLEFVVCV
jgi:hypothetical protein